MTWYYLVVFGSGREVIYTLGENDHPMDKGLVDVETISKGYESREDLMEGENRNE